MLGLLDRPASAAPDTTAHEYKYNTGNARDTASIARVFFVNTAENSLQLQQLTNEVRTATQMQRTFPNYQAKAILLRGTGDQVSRAEQILKDK
jgi:threonine aldolase